MTFYSSDIPVAREATQIELAAPAPSKPSLYRTRGKRTLDLALVIMTAPITIVVTGILAIAVLLTGQSPFYVQQRVGLHGKVFRMWKLRTMLPDAERRLEDFLAKHPEAREEWESKQKLIVDPRVTPIGTWLRKTSLDELPQLFNVLNGTMSLVGPRPMMVDQKDQYSGVAYYRLRPGITGFWQVSDRNDCDFGGRVHFDDMYDRVVSLKVDITVLLKTVAVVIRGTGV